MPASKKKKTTIKKTGWKKYITRYNAERLERKKKIGRQPAVAMSIERLHDNMFGHDCSSRTILANKNKRIKRHSHKGVLIKTHHCNAERRKPRVDIVISHGGGDVVKYSYHYFYSDIL